MIKKEKYAKLSFKQQTSVTASKFHDVTNGVAFNAKAARINNITSKQLYIEIPYIVPCNSVPLQ